VALSKSERDKILGRKFPPEALMKVQKNSKLTLTAIKASYVIERLHEAYEGDLRVNGKYEVGFIPNALLNKSEVIGKYTKKEASPIFGSKAYVLFTGTLRLGQEPPIDIMGLRDLDDQLNWEDTAKSARTNAICKAVFENKLVGLDVFKGYYSWDGNDLVVTDPEAVAEAQRLAEEEAAKIRGEANRQKLIVEMLEWASQNKEKARTMIANFKKDYSLEFESIRSLDGEMASRLYRVFMQEREK
jgi:hypothetical protein